MGETEKYKKPCLCIATDAWYADGGRRRCGLSIISGWLILCCGIVMKGVPRMIKGSSSHGLFTLGVVTA